METRRIDTHTHVVPPFYRDWLGSKGIDAGGLPIPEWSAESALAMMGRNGIATSILSVSTPGVEPGEKQEAQDMARRLNDYAAGIVADHPGRFGFFATVTLPDVQGSVIEAKRALDTLKADGIVLHAQTNGVYLGDPSMTSLLEELNAREIIVLVHPSALPGGAADGIPAYWADFLLDTVRAAMNLVRTGTVAKYPKIKYILSHGGGFLPFAASRIAGELNPKNSEEALATLRSFYFDTTLSSSEFALPTLLAFADPQQITFGSDFPYAPEKVSQIFTTTLDEYSGLDHHAVNRGNAEAIFIRLRDLS